MDTKSRRHAIKEIKNISNKNLKKAEQMNKLETAKMDKTLNVIDKSTRYRLWCMERYMDRIASKAQARKQQESYIIRYITMDPMRRSWSEESSNWDIDRPRGKDRRHTRLLERAKQHESKALVDATLCLNEIVSITQPVSLPPIKSNNAGDGHTHWVLPTDMKCTKVP